MSLILAARFKGGILLAADPFYFDNDGAVPSKGMRFDKFIVSESIGYAMAGVGSVWVLEKAGEWLASEKPTSGALLPSLAAKWKALNQEWKKNRENEISESEDKSLRPISDSLFVLAKSDDLSKIHIGDSDGQLHSTETFVLTGSGSSVVRYFMKSTGERFSPEDTLQETLDLTFKCYRAASMDLFVVGFPSIVVVKKDALADFSEKCASLWDNAKAVYFDGLVEEVLGR